MSDYLPLEVIGEILLGLPAKSVLRFRSVCKTWYSLISNSCFANAYLARSNQRSSPYFLFGRREHEKVCFSLHSNPAIDSSDFIEFHLPYETYGYEYPYFSYGWSWNSLFQIVGSVNGLICLVDSHNELHEKYFLWNPSINRTVRLPFVRNLFSAKCKYRHGFGYHAPTNEYKVVRIIHFDDFAMVEICALNSSREWQRYCFSASFYLLGETSVFMNGRFHWLAQDYNMREDDTCHNFILSFDLGYEIVDENVVYHEVPVPKVLKIDGDQYSLEWEHIDIAMLNGLLALHGRLDEKYDVWVMKEYGVVESWTKLYAIDLGERLGRVIGFKKNGEVLITMNDRDLLLYEPNSQRTVWKLQKNYALSCFYLDNYMESLVLFDTDGV